jgi:Cu/Ag efflux protein CusF
MTKILFTTLFALALIVCSGPLSAQTMHDHMNHGDMAPPAAGQAPPATGQAPPAPGQMAAPPMAPDLPTGVYEGTGSIVSIDKDNSRATIKHDPMPAIKWPAMTMTFTVSDAALLDNVKEGGKVRFDLEIKPDSYSIVDLEAQ